MAVKPLKKLKSDKAFSVGFIKIASGLKYCQPDVKQRQGNKSYIHTQVTLRQAVSSPHSLLLSPVYAVKSEFLEKVLVQKVGFTLITHSLLGAVFPLFL